MLGRIVLAYSLIAYLSVGGGVLWAINLCYVRTYPFGWFTDMAYVLFWPLMGGVRLVMPYAACTTGI